MKTSKADNIPAILTTDARGGTALTPSQTGAHRARRLFLEAVYIAAFLVVLYIVFKHVIAAVRMS